MAVFELTGVTTLRRRLAGRSGAGADALVGRQHELTPHAALAQAQAGHGQVVALMGEAGVGKSRLAYELRLRTPRRAG